MKKVTALKYNWMPTGDFQLFEVGKNNVVSIDENEPHNGMQLWNYLVHYSDGSSVRIFNPNSVSYSK